MAPCVDNAMYHDILCVLVMYYDLVCVYCNKQCSYHGLEIRTMVRIRTFEPIWSEKGLAFTGNPGPDHELAVVCIVLFSFFF